MIMIPIYDSLILPGVAIHFRKDVLADYNVEVHHVDEEVLFIFSKHPAKRHELKTESFYPIRNPKSEPTETSKKPWKSGKSRFCRIRRKWSRTLSPMKT